MNLSLVLFSCNILSTGEKLRARRFLTLLSCWTIIIHGAVGWFQFLNRTEQACSGSYDDSCGTRGSVLGPQSLLGFLWRGLCIRFFLKPKRITHHTTAELKQLFFFPRRKGEKTKKRHRPTDVRCSGRSSIHAARTRISW